jgi:hypothetical protein
MTQEEASNSGAGAASSWWSALATSAVSAMAVAKRDLSEIVDTIKRDITAALLDPEVSEPRGAGSDVGCSEVAAAGTVGRDAGVASESAVAVASESAVAVASESAVAVPPAGGSLVPNSDSAAALLRARLQKLQEEESEEALGWGDEPDDGGSETSAVSSTEALDSSEAAVPTACTARGDTSAEADASAHPLPPNTAPTTAEATAAVVAAEGVSDPRPSDTVGAAE